MKRYAFINRLLLIATGCSINATDRFERLFSDGLDVVDLTHALDARAPFWPNPNGNPFIHDTLAAHPSGAPAMAAYSVPEHHGTHLDAPIHSADGQLSVDQLTASHLFGPAAVIDIAATSATNPDYLLSTEDLRTWETRHGQIPRGAIVILHTGWSEKWNDPIAYRNTDAEGRMHFPTFSEEVARFLITDRDIKGIGIDNFSVDLGVSGNFPVHRIVNGAGKFHLENVANTHLLPSLGAYLIVAPVKIQGGSGGQVRVFAVLP